MLTPALHLRFSFLIVGVVSLMAGSSESGYSDGIGSNTRFCCPCGVVCTSDGSKLVVADRGNHRLRLIHTATNEVSTLAGNGEAGHSDGQAMAVSLKHTDRATPSPDSVLYIACGVWGPGIYADSISVPVRSVCALAAETLYVFLSPVFSP